MIVQEAVVTLGEPAFGQLKVLELTKVCKVFGTDPAVHALTEIDLVAERGEWLAITGPSGSGKSTLLNILGCLDRPSSGSFRLDGIDTATLTEDQRAGLRSQRIGFIFQSFHLLPYRTALENVMLAEVYRRGSSRGRHERAQEALRRVGLSHRVNFLPLKLSGGEKQRVAIARTLLKNPPVLIFDEATSALDSANERAIQAELRAVSQGKTALVIAHRLSTVVDAHQIVVLQAGRVVECGRHAELLALGGRYAEMWRLQQSGDSAGDSER